MSAVKAIGADRQAAEPVHGQFLTFSLGDEVYATDIHRVREIIQHGPMTTVPQMPRCVRGVINLRGAVVPVMDLRVRFERDPAEIGKKSCIVIFDGEQSGAPMEVGVLVDAVNEVIELDRSLIEPPPAFGAATSRDFIRGMGKVGSRFVIILDPSRALDLSDGDRTSEPAPEGACA